MPSPVRAHAAHVCAWGDLLATRDRRSALPHRPALGPRGATARAADPHGSFPARILSRWPRERMPA